MPGCGRALAEAIVGDPGSDRLPPGSGHPFLGPAASPHGQLNRTSPPQPSTPQNRLADPPDGKRYALAPTFAAFVTRAVSTFFVKTGRHDVSETWLPTMRKVIVR